MPVYDVRERHATRVSGEPAAIYDAILRADLASAPFVRALLGLRALPGAIGALARGRGAGIARRWRAPVDLRALEASGFRVVEAAPPHELVIGLEGRFWTPGGDLRRELDAASFRAAPPPGTARGAWNFVVTPLGGGACELATETRVRCADAPARRRFRPYWLLIRPWSGLIRRFMLREIRREAERLSTP
jgi:hypothetical protein